MIPCHAVAARRSTLLAEALHRVAASKYTYTRVLEHEPGTAARGWATAQDRDTAAARSTTQPTRCPKRPDGIECEPSGQLDACPFGQRPHEDSGQ
jgi:hypothetical protein